MPGRIRYPDTQIGQHSDGLVFECLMFGDGGQNSELLAAIGGLKAAAYTRQLEGTGPNMLRPGTMSAELRKKEQNASQTGQPSNDVIRIASTWFTRAASNPLQIDGMASTRLMSPTWDMEANILGPEDDEFYINDILAREPKQGIGSAALHASLYTLNSRDLCCLDGYKGSSVNDWYKKIGFRSIGEGPDVHFGNQTLQTERFIADTVGDVRQALETQHPALKIAICE